MVYIPVLENILSVYPCADLAGCGMLYDIDNDGTRELIAMYYNTSDISFYYSVYTIQNGQAIPLKKDEYVFTAIDTSYGDIGIVQYQGAPAFVVRRYDGGYGVVDYDEIHVLSVENLSEIAVFTKEGVWSFSQSNGYYEVTDSICTINGKICSYNEYQNALSAIKDIDILPAFFFNDPPSPMVSGKLFYDFLCILQQEAGVTASRQALYSTGDAEAIAYEKWSSYLMRNQGFQWAIIKQDSIIKNGTEYYCYTLQNDSMDKWSISEYLFFNSVTGEYSNKLY